jgi:hypothetical protein
MKKFPLFGVGIALLFIILGINLISRDDKFAVIVGYVCIIFNSGLIIFTLIKLLSNRNKN